MKLSISELTEVLVVIVVVVVAAVLVVKTLLMPHGRVGPSQGPTKIGQYQSSILIFRTPP